MVLTKNKSFGFELCFKELAWKFRNALEKLRQLPTAETSAIWILDLVTNQQHQDEDPRETYCVVTCFLITEERLQEHTSNIFYFPYLFPVPPRGTGPNHICFSATLFPWSVSL